MLLAVTTSAALTAASFPAIADDVVIGGGDPDTVAPVFQNVTISQDHVDVSDGPVTLTVTTRITDDKSGFSHGSIGIHEPAGGSGSDYSAYLYSGYRTTGDANDGTYTSTIQVDQYAKPGTYQIYCQAWDLKSNRTTTCPDDTVVVQPDFTPPTIEECVAETGTASTSAGETTVPVRVEASDDASGVQTVTATIRDDASGSSYSGDLSMTGGTKNDGTWKGTVTVPGDAPAGDYDLSCDAEDEVGRGTGPTPGTGGDGSGGAVVVTPEPPIGGGTGDGGTGGGGAGGGGGTGAETGDADLVLTKTVDRAEALQGVHGLPGFTCQPPAGLGVAGLGQRVGDGVQVRRDVQAVQDHVVAGVHDGGHLRRGHHPHEARQEPGSADPTGQHHDHRGAGPVRSGPVRSGPITAGTATCPPGTPCRRRPSSPPTRRTPCGAPNPGRRLPSSSRRQAGRSRPERPAPAGSRWRRPARDRCR